MSHPSNVMAGRPLDHPPATRPRVLIITPTLGTSGYLPAAVDSVRQIRAAEVRHILVCPADRIEALREQYPACEVTADQGRAGGIYGAINAGLTAAPDGWDWFTYINDDDLLAPGFDRLLAAHARAGKPATVAYGDIMNIDRAGRPLGRMTVARSPGQMPALLQQGISPTGQQGMLFGAPVVRSLHGYRLQFKLCADLDFWARAHAAGFGFVYYPWTVGCFRIQPGQLSGDVALTREELRAVTTESFPRPTTALARRLARWRFRLANAPRYLERWRAVGRLTSSESLLGGGGQAKARAKGVQP